MLQTVEEIAIDAAVLQGLFYRHAARLCERADRDRKLFVHLLHKKYEKIFALSIDMQKNLC